MSTQIPEIALTVKTEESPLIGGTSRETREELPLCERTLARVVAAIRLESQQTHADYIQLQALAYRLERGEIKP